MGGLRGPVLLKPFEQRCKIGLDKNHRPMLQADETSVKHVVERGEQESVVAGDIEEAAGSPILAEVRSSKDLEESF